MSKLRWLTAAAVEAIQIELIDAYGGSYGVRDHGLLESALARVPNLHMYSGIMEIPNLGAVISWGILRNHPFVDGNKRAALAALFTFLDLNGWKLSCSEAEETVMTLRAAAGEIDEEEWIKWVYSASQAISKRSPDEATLITAN